VAKLKTIRLSFPHAPDPRVRDQILYEGQRSQEERNRLWDAARRYRIEIITDSTEFNPGEYMERSMVNNLTGSDDWRVTIVPVKEIA
jgi:hypothetical protein